MVYTSGSCRSAPNDTLACIEPCNRDVAEVDRPDAVLDLIEPHVLSVAPCHQEARRMLCHLHAWLVATPHLTRTAANVMRAVHDL